MAKYKSSHTGAQVDNAVDQVLNKTEKVQWGNIEGDITTQTDLQNAITTKQDTSNLVTTLSSTSTDVQYPSAKCVYDIIGNVETLLGGI